MDCTKHKPTTTVYTELQTAFDFFNKELFGDSLPQCLITMQREKKFKGYFYPERFVSHESIGEVTANEIAMNPRHFMRQSMEQTLSTLVHEMVHVWQFQYGKPGRRGYHNAEFARKMKEVGLYPSDTGMPGGHEVGQKMTHYIMEDGLFRRKVEKLVTKEFRISWGDKIVHEKESEKKNKTNRVKYICPNCTTQVWGKPEISLKCGDCDEYMEGE